MFGIVDSLALVYSWFSYQSMLVTFLTAVIIYACIRMIKDRKYCLELEAHLAIMEKAMDEFRNVRHQHNNMLQSIVFYIENEQWESDENFVEEIMEKTSELNKNNVLQLIKIKNRQVRSSVSKMAEMCEKNGIDFSITVSGDVRHINMHESSLTSALEIIFNHIFNEVMKFIKKEIIIEICSDSQGVLIVFDSHFDNSYCNLNVKVDKAAVKKIISRNRNVIFNSYINNNYHRQEIMIMSQ